MVAYSVKDRARTDLARLATSRLDSDGFRWEAASIMRRVVGMDGWYWVLVDPGAGLPTRHVGENAVVGQSIRDFCLRHPELVVYPWQAPAGPVSVLSAVTDGDLARDRAWEESFGPAGMGDQMRAPLTADGLCWAQLHLHRDSAGRFFSAEDAEFIAEVAPLLATRLRDGLRTGLADGEAVPVGDSADDSAGDSARDSAGYSFEPGTIVLDEELSVTAATPAAGRWIDRLGLVKPGTGEPLPIAVYAVATRAALSRVGGADPSASAKVRLQSADGRWTVVRAAPLLGATGGYVITLETARSQDLAPLLMRALSFTAREREVAQLVIDGLPSEDIARALFISVYTVRDHVKAILRKADVSRRHDLIATLGGSA